jgi:ABC-2 type transport system permease protein
MHGRRLPVTAKAYARIARNSALTISSHRAGFVMGSIGTTCQLVALAALWSSLLAGGVQLGGFSLPQMKGYLFVGFASGVLATAHRESQLAARITDGTVALDLVKPMQYQTMRFAEQLGGLVIELAMILVVLGAFVFLAGPVSAPAQLGLVVLSLLLVVPIKFLIIYASTLACFWTSNYHGIAWARTALIAILSGALVPLVLLPQPLRALARATPFPSMTSAPGLIYVGQASGAHAWTLIGIQAAWAAGLWLIALQLWRVAVRRLAVSGG